jgi:hypothetical protein
MLWLWSSIYHDQNTVGRGFDMPWVGCSIYHGLGVRYAMGMAVKIAWVGLSK